MRPVLLLLSSALAACDGKGTGDGDTGAVSDDTCGDLTWFADEDGDGAGAGAGVSGCKPAERYVANNADCDDSDPEVHPGAVETWYDGIDADCNGASDYDADGDGHDDDAHGGDDCDDHDATVLPGAEDAWYDGVDADCDGASDYDADGDGYDSEPYGGPDCDDADPTEPVVAATWGTELGAGTVEDPLDTVQGAINQAEGCVAVEPGTYHEVIDLLGKELSVVGVQGWEETILDGEGLGAPVVTIASGEGPGTRLRGLTLQHGDGYYTTRTWEHSRGEYCEGYDLCVWTVRNWYGGAMLVSSSSATLEGMVLRDSFLPEGGYEREGCSDYGTDTSTCTQTFAGSYGGGLAVLDGGTVGLTDSQVLDNVADEGGGISAFDASEVSISTSLVEGNQGIGGGGIYLYDASLVVRSSVLADNTSDYGAGQLESHRASSVDLLDTVLSGGISSGDGSSLSWSGCGAIADASSGLRVRRVTILNNAGALASLCALSPESTTVFDSILQTNSLGYVVVIAGADEPRDEGPVLDATYTAFFNDGDDPGRVDCAGSGNLCEPCTFSDWSDDGDSTNDDLSIVPGTACSGAASDGGDLGARGPVGPP